MKLVFATTNQGKVVELDSLVRGLGVEVLSAAQFPPLSVIEDGQTLEENACKKARAFLAHTGIASLADDTGLFVDALGGLPGVHSARFAEAAGRGPFHGSQDRYRANNELLLEQMEGVPVSNRGAEFRCALSLALPGGGPCQVVQGRCRGRIADRPRGEQGFGFDPLFELPELAKTFAELTAQEKNQLSHRARAFQALRPLLEALGGGAKR